MSQVPKDRLEDEPLQRCRYYNRRCDEYLQSDPRLEAHGEPGKDNFEQANDQMKQGAVKGTKIDWKHFNDGR
jgi:hypothetical protein